MQYPQFRRDGWPIGSGMVESANKNVVEVRLKGPCMHWERKNVNPMLAFIVHVLPARTHTYAHRPQDKAEGVYEELIHL